MAADLGGRAYFVGGCVRDSLLGIPSKDVDIEVHGLEPAALESVLDSLGERLEFGKSFGIYSLRGTNLDIALPRRETSVGGGHRDFTVEVDPYIGVKKAAARRDFTVNALMRDVLTDEVLDFFGGCSDLKKKVIRHVSADSFGEDPLRVLRGAQFAARFGFSVAEETIALCREMDLSGLSPERVLEETKKALLQSEKPSVFFETLRAMDQLSVWFPEVQALIGVQQNPKFHPEGDVWVHTMLVLDGAAAYRDQVQNPLGFMFSALAHDFGKPKTTENRNGVWHAYHHEIEGVSEAEKFMKRLTNEKNLIRYVLNMVEHHMKPNVMAGAGSSVRATNRLYDSSVEPEALICLALCDSMGKGLRENETEKFLRERLAVYRDTMSKPYVMGRDLIEAGLTPDGSFTQLLEYAHKLRLAGVPKESALKQTLSYKRSLKK